MKAQIHKDKVKTIFNNMTKKTNFQVDDLVLRWDAKREDKGKHDKFDNV